jgi:trehalose-6-phosphatase
MTGKANLEVRPKFVNKGEIAKTLVQNYGEGSGNAPEFVLCMGDDFTDEGMYCTLRFSDHSANTYRHVPIAATVQTANGSRILGHCWRQLEANVGKLASSRAFGCHFCDLVAKRISRRRQCWCDCCCRRNGS